MIFTILTFTLFFYFFFSHDAPTKSLLYIKTKQKLNLSSSFLSLFQIKAQSASTEVEPVPHCSAKIKSYFHFTV